MLRRLLGARSVLVIVLMGLILLSGVAESLGVSMALPLVATVIGVAPGGGIIEQFGSAVRALMPAEHELEGLLGLLALAFLCKGVLLLTTHALGDYISLRLRDDWAGRILRYYLTAPFQDVLREKQGTLVHNVIGESHQASRGVAVLLLVVNRLVLTLFLVAVLLIANWQVTLGVALGGGVLFYALRKATFTYSVRFGALQQKMQQEVAAIGAESIAGRTEIRLFGTLERMSARLMEHLHRHTMAQTWFRAMKTVPTQLTEFLVIVILGAALLALSVTAGGDLSAYVAPLAFFMLVTQRLLTNFTMLVQERMNLASYLPSMRLVYDLLERTGTAERVDVGETFTGLDGDIVLRDVTFGYEPGRDVLHGLTMTIPKGRTTAILGPSGMGKSTLADLLLGLLQPQGGSILFGSRALKDFSLASVRRSVGYVTQHPLILNASIRDNIRFGDPDASDEQVRSAAKLAHADVFIDRLPQGLDTRLGDRGATLSGGERQRIAVARAILRRPSIYVLDEATSALDPESEGFLRDSIRTLAGEATVVVIAHRPSAAVGADVSYRLTTEGARRIALADLPS